MGRAGVLEQIKMGRTSVVKTKRDLAAIIKKEMPGWRIVEGYKFPKNNTDDVIRVKVENGILRKSVGVSVSTGKIAWYEG
jgi:hypothetical protein